MNVVIIGGGTSGLVTAAMMQNFWKSSAIDVNISLYYDPDVKTIGVGEGTTPSFIDMIQEDLGYNIDDALRELKATVKLGVLFKNWVVDEEYYHGFGQVTVNKDMDDNYACIHSLLNDSYNGGVNWNHANNLIPQDIDNVGLAFHITTDNLADFLFRYLKGKVNIVADKILEIESDGNNIQSVICENSGKIEADLWVDATGFKSILFNKLNAEWVDLSQWLPIDSAIPQIVPNNTNKIPTYTLSEATRDGWIWQIPTQDRFGTGYLFSSKFTLDDEARSNYHNWLLTNHGVQLETDRIIKWKTGYYKKAWIGNCFAVGLSGGFTEPLEALTHQYLTFMVESFLSLNSTLNNLDYNRDRLNMCQERFFYDISNFLNLHYCTNRIDTPFWKHMTNNKTKWVKTLEEKCKHEFLDIFRTDDMLDYWGHDNYIQVMNGIHMFNKNGIKNYINSRHNPEFLYKDSKRQYDSIEEYKNNMKMIDHKEYLESLNYTLPYI
tara:strand:- start:566 stop:2044 length:1479 start_codon:yes stop_codon:yes gene_type:complete